MSIPGKARVLVPITIFAVGNWVMVFPMQNTACFCCRNAMESLFSCSSPEPSLVRYSRATSSISGRDSEYLSHALGADSFVARVSTSV